MKKKSTTIAALLSAAILIATAFVKQLPSVAKEKNMYMRLSDVEYSDSARSSTISDEINEAWDDIEIGDSLVEKSEYDDAIIAYRKAYSKKVASRSVSGIVLVELYEKLSKYEDAISQINNMINDGVLNDVGVNRMLATKSRLLAAKNASQK